MSCTRETSTSHYQSHPCRQRGASMLFQSDGRSHAATRTVQVLLNMLEFGMDPQQALAGAWLCLNSSKRGEGSHKNSTHQAWRQSVHQAALCRGIGATGIVL